MTGQEFKFQNVWNDKSERHIQEIVEFWKAQNVLPSNADLTARASQVVCLVRDREDKIVGVSSAYLSDIVHLKNKLFILRSMVHPDFRMPGLFQKLIVETLNCLESVHNDYDPKPIGVIAEFENENLKKIRDVVTRTGFVFIGFAANGNPLRVFYFKGAKF